LLDLYYIYFDHETRGNYDDANLKKINEKVIFEFLRDYDICPTLVSYNEERGRPSKCMHPHSDNVLGTFQRLRLELLR